MRRPALTRYAEAALNPLIGKSLVVYAVKPVSEWRGAVAPGLSGATEERGSAAREGTAYQGAPERAGNTA
jgi:hypothetical protein